MMPNFEYRIRCSGKGKPWHKAGSNRIHTYRCASGVKALTDVDTWSVEARTPGALDCLPMVSERREVSVWRPLQEAE